MGGFASAKAAKRPIFDIIPDFGAEVKEKDCACTEMRNPKNEILNKFELTKSQGSKRLGQWSFGAAGWGGYRKGKKESKCKEQNYNAKMKKPVYFDAERVRQR